MDKQAKARHTPGPWTTDGGRWVFGADKIPVAEARAGGERWSPTPAQAELAAANARLIAAAPELLAALEAAAKWMDMCGAQGGASAAISKAEAAIAAAKGE